MDDQEKPSRELPARNHSQLSTSNESIQQPPAPISEDATSVARRQKASQVLAICNASADRGELAALATSIHGLASDEVRKKAWPILLEVPRQLLESNSLDPSWRDLPPHKDEDQVRLDVHRSFVYYPKYQSETQLNKRKAELSDVIVQVLRKHPRLCYFQGFHDIAQVFLLVLGLEKAAVAIEYISLLRIRDFMLPSLTPSLAHLRLLLPILSVVDDKLCRHVSATNPFFALGATLTLYAHDIQEYADIARLFDFLLAQPAVMSIYFFAVTILARKKEILEIPTDEPEILHVVLSRLPQPLKLDEWISESEALFNQYPPEKLPRYAWWRVSRYSVLKTTRDWSLPQSLVAGQDLFDDHARQVRREENLRRLQARAWHLRRPIGGIGFAMLIGALAIWLQRSGHDGVAGIITSRIWGLLRMIRRQ